MYFETYQEFKKMLGQLDKWLGMGNEFAKSKSFDPIILSQARLAPDQFPLWRQVASCCDTAKLTASRLTGKAAPSHEDKEVNLDELRTRVQSVIEYLGTFAKGDFEQAATREITNPRWEGKTMTGADYFQEHAIPNFYFHLAHTYALLRHNGVPVGKRDYLGQMTMKG